VLAEDADAEALYQAAVDHLQRSDARPDLGRADLLYREWLRRHRRRRQAREHLPAALEVFEPMGARLFAARASGELRAIGERTRRRTPQTRYDLTPQEKQIAGLAAEGLSNREIAARLFISAGTVDYHLRKVFQKLGVSSRKLVRNALTPSGTAGGFTSHSRIDRAVADGHCKKNRWSRGG
jgi:DNA-binding NarL/FixJ family response regulator